MKHLIIVVTCLAIAYSALAQSSNTSHKQDTMQHTRTRAHHKTGKTDSTQHSAKDSANKAPDAKSRRIWP